MSSRPRAGEQRAVEVRPEVVFLYELLQELAQGRIRIPRFQRAFVWRRDQMTDLLDSVNRQYPIGSLLVWETDRDLATLERLGPFRFPSGSGPVGYLLDGHQRLSTLAGALTSRESHHEIADDSDPGRWQLVYDLDRETFEHGSAKSAVQSRTFPLPALLDTRRFFDEIDVLRKSFGPELARIYTDRITEVARSFQSYRVPVIRIRQTDSSEAVEIFARLNSKGQAMSADQMVSALMYRDPADDAAFDLSETINRIVEECATYGFPDIDRTTILRAVLANLGEDIYRTDWTRLTLERREEMRPRMEDAANRTVVSVAQALEFVRSDLGIHTGRLLPYAMQVVVLSAFFDSVVTPTAAQLTFLRRWFWVGSFAGWFGSTNPSRINSLVGEFRLRVASEATPELLENFDMHAEALPYPASFDLRSARTRALMAATLALGPRDQRGERLPAPWEAIAAQGPGAIGHVMRNPPKEFSGNPANRLLRPPGEESASLRGWIERMVTADAWQTLESYAVPEDAARALIRGDERSFILLREERLKRAEADFAAARGVRVSSRDRAFAPVDTE